MNRRPGPGTKDSALSRSDWVVSVLQWLAANLFLLAIILAGAGSFWILGAAVKSMPVGEDFSNWLLSVAAVGSIFVAYYSGKWLHHLITRRR